MSSIKMVVILTVYGIAISIFTVVFHTWYVSSNIQPVLQPKFASLTNSYDELKNTFGDNDLHFVQIVDKSVKAVVQITADSEREANTSLKDIGKLQFGSGVIIAPNGYIVTNYHVIKDANSIKVKLFDNRSYDASIVGKDPNTDIALLRIESENLPYLEYGNSDSLLVGEWVLAIGNPFRFKSTVTAGIVSAKARNINILETYGIESFIQTDAAVNPGNSGGALINRKGQLMGINTAILSQSNHFEGFSFAIPSTIVRKVTKDIIEFGSVQRGILGVEMENVDSEIAESLQLESVQGVYISSVIKDEAAYVSGLLTGDIIIQVENKQIDNTSQLMEVLATYSPGNSISIQYVRNGKKLQTEAVLKNANKSFDLLHLETTGICKEIGCSARNLDSYEKSTYATKGIAIISVLEGSIIAQSKMEAGYIVTKVNNQMITSLKEFTDILEASRGTMVKFDGFYKNFSGNYPYQFFIPK